MVGHLSTYFSLFCHQLPERSPHFHGEAFPLCYRCAGLFIGLALTYIFLAVNSNRSIRIASLKQAAPMLLLIAIWTVDSIAGYINLWATPGILRAFTGLGAGISLPFFLLQLKGTRTGTIVNFRLFHLLMPALSGCALLYLLQYPGSQNVFSMLVFIVAIGITVFLLHWVLLSPFRWQRKTKTATT